MPAGGIRFPKEIYKSPRVLLEGNHNLVHFTDDAKKGGHFAAMEQPAALAADMRSFFYEVAPLHAPKAAP